MSAARALVAVAALLRAGVAVADGGAPVPMAVQDGSDPAHADAEDDRTTAESVEVAPDVAWVPGRGGRTIWVRDGLDPTGILVHTPVRLHLRLGGFVDGDFEGARMERTGGEVVLAIDGRPVIIDAGVVAATSPLAAPSGFAIEPPEPLVLTPTWRSHVGAVLSYVVPGAGQWIQRRDRALGVVFFALGAFLDTSGILALSIQAGGQPKAQRQAIGVLALGLSVGNSTLAAIHAWRTGRELRPARPERRGGPLRAPSAR